MDYDAVFDDYRDIWFEYYKKGLPNMLAFWGTAIIISGLLLIFTNFNLVFVLITFTLAAIPAALTIMSYQAHLRAAKDLFRNLPQNSKTFHMTFYEDADGFDSVNGKNFSYISWDSIRTVRENERCFVFEKGGNYFIIPKSAFRSPPELDFFKNLVDTNVNNRIERIG